MRWVVQSNLGKKEDVEDIEAACKKHNYEFIPWKAIPFSEDTADELHEAIGIGELTIFYGATNFIDQVYRSYSWYPGVYFNPLCVCPTWMEFYGKKALNYEGSEITTIHELSTGKYSNLWNDTGHLFIRPYNDKKAFTGTVVQAKELKEWANNLMTNELDLQHLPVMACQPRNIEQEWRLFFARREWPEVLTSTKYRENGRLKEDPHVPTEVVEFGEELAEIYSPTDAFIMDVCSSEGQLYVLELGCIDSAGFYAADIERVVHGVTEAHYYRVEARRAIKPKRRQK